MSQRNLQRGTGGTGCYWLDKDFTDDLKADRDDPTAVGTKEFADAVIRRPPQGLVTARTVVVSRSALVRASAFSLQSGTPIA